MSKAQSRRSRSNKWQNVSSHLSPSTLALFTVPSRSPTLRLCFHSEPALQPAGLGGAFRFSELAGCLLATANAGSLEGLVACRLCWRLPWWAAGMASKQAKRKEVHRINSAHGSDKSKE